MLTEEQLRTLPPKAREFWRQAFQFVKERQTEWFLVQAGSKQFEAWRDYFRRQGWRPFAIRMIEEGKIKQMTMPTEWPEWFTPDSLPQREAAE